MLAAYTTLRLSLGGARGGANGEAHSGERGGGASSSSPSPTIPPGVALLELARPGAGNALSTISFTELPAALAALSTHPGVRAIVIAGAGKHFCTGADLSALTGAASVSQSNPADPAAGRAALLALIRSWQAAFTALEACPLPVIAAVHGACVGAGIDLITAADVRVADENATFCVKEVDLGIVADLGTLQRLRLLVGDGVARDWALTARKVTAGEAERAGLVCLAPAGVCVREAALALAATLAAKPPRALAGTKAVLLAARDQSVAAGLEHVALWNGGGALPSAEVAAALEQVGRSRL